METCMEVWKVWFYYIFFIYIWSAEIYRFAKFVTPIQSFPNSSQGYGHIFDVHIVW